MSFIVFRPTPDTALERSSPPPLEEVARGLATARAAFPQTPLYLGCLRPGGVYRDKRDCLALRAGINKIVQPAPAAAAWRKTGLEACAGRGVLRPVSIRILLEAGPHGPDAFKERRTCRYGLPAAR